MKAALLAVLALLVPAAARADGMMLGTSGPAELVPERAQHAWIAWRDGRETLTLAVEPGGGASKLAWLVPLPVPAAQARLTLAAGAPTWGGRELRAEARDALAPGGILLYFAVLSLAGAGGGEAAVVLGVIAALWSIAIPQFGGLSGPTETAVTEYGRVELAGVTSELVEAPTLEALRDFLSRKSLTLPEAAGPALAEHVKAGRAFAVSWADRPEAGKSLSLAAEFPAPLPWYPVRLTSAYGAVRTPVDLRVEGWVEPAGLPPSARVGYYADPGGPPRTTRVVFIGYADELSSDWTFPPRARTADLRLAAWFAGSGSLVLLPLAALLAGLAVWGALWGFSHPGRALLFALAGVLPVLGPRFAVRRLRAGLDGVGPVPLPEGMSAGEARLLTMSGGAFLLLEAAAFAAGAAWDLEWLMLSGWLFGGAGVALLLRGQGRRWTDSLAVGVVTAPFYVIGPLACLLPFDPREAAAAEAKRAALAARRRNRLRRLFRRPEEPEPPAPPVPEVTATPAELRWKRAALASGVLALALAEGATFALAPLWPLERSTAVITTRGGLVQRSREGATRGHLGTLRSALAAYRGDHEGRLPASLAELAAGGKYIDTLPAAKLADHPDSDAVKVGARLDDAGGWLYDPDAKDGEPVRVNCTHADSKGRPWDAQ